MIRRACVIALLLLAASPALGQTRRWELEPRPDPRLMAGRISVIGGITNEEGVRFVINGLDIMQPVQAVLASESPGTALRLLVYKETPDRALLDRATDARGAADVKFRTADSVQMRVTGPAGSRYQLMTWVGPRVVRPSLPLFTAIDATGAPAAAPAAPSATPAAQTPVRFIGVNLTVIAILLGFILAALLVIIVLLFRGRSKGTAGLFLLAALGAGSLAAAQPADPLDPYPVKEVDTWKEINDRLGKLREALDTFEKAGIKVEPEAISVRHPDDKEDEQTEKDKPTTAQRVAKLPAQIVTNGKLILAFLEEFGLIDPREAAVQPQYEPPGQPMIPSRCAADERCGECFGEANAQLDKARRLLEDQYVIYKKTELEAGRIHELASAAAGLSPYAQLLWNVTKANPNEPMNVAQQKFYAAYDGNLEKLLTMVNEGLIGVGKCERDNFQDHDWYARYGMVYYNFMKERYTRK